jgi:hypothetical protein
MDIDRCDRISQFFKVEAVRLSESRRWVFQSREKVSFSFAQVSHFVAAELHESQLRAQLWMP